MGFIRENIEQGDKYKQYYVRQVLNVALFKFLQWKL